ncbi:MAG: hypothetical protein JW738_00700 [Actinobacteria bacterium]|nr:hypothetical protein [Actinomycetota bacterium]
MNTVVDIAEVIGGFGILVAIMYAIWQVREARRGREATFFANAFAQSPTEITLEMEVVRQGMKDGTMTCEKFKGLDYDHQERLLSPLNMFDTMGWMVSMGAIRLDSVIKYCGAEVITRSWDAYESFVIEMRENTGDYFYFYFEDLVNRIRRLKRVSGVSSDTR